MPNCRDIGPNAPARFQSLSAAYAGLHVRPGGGDTGLEPPTTFLNDTPDWDRYQHGRSFDLSALNDADTRRCLTTALGYTENPAISSSSLPSLHQDLRGTLAMVDYFRRSYDPNNLLAGGNRADPNDPNDTGDPNMVTQFEIEQFVWNTVRNDPESVRWNHMRDQGDGTMRRLHAVLGLAQFLTTEPPPSAITTSAPAPERSEGERSWYDRNRTWVEVGGLVAAAGLACFFGFAIRRTRIEASESRVETQRLENEISGVRERMQRFQDEISTLETQKQKALEALNPINSVNLAEVNPRVESLQRSLKSARMELSAAQMNFEQAAQELASRRRPSKALRDQETAARTRLDSALSNHARIEAALRNQQSLAGIGSAYHLLSARPAAN